MQRQDVETSLHRTKLTCNDSDSDCARATGFSSCQWELVPATRPTGLHCLSLAVFTSDSCELQFNGPLRNLSCRVYHKKMQSGRTVLRLCNRFNLQSNLCVSGLVGSKLLTQHWLLWTFVFVFFFFLHCGCSLVWCQIISCFVTLVIFVSLCSAGLVITTPQGTLVSPTSSQSFVSGHPATTMIVSALHSQGKNAHINIHILTKLTLTVIDKSKSQTKSNDECF